MVYFKCLRSGTIVSFTNENDIAGLRTHEGYEEVNVETDTLEAEPAAQAEEKMTKLRGRPPKVK